MGVVGLSYYIQLSIRHNIKLGLHLWTLCNMVHVGLVTTLFHVTLQFEHQILDKMGMYFLLSAGISVTYTRSDPKSWLHHLNVLQSTCLGIAFWSVKEDRDGTIMKGLTIVWSIYIGFGLTYLVYSLQFMAIEVGKDCEKVFDQLFTCLFIAVFGWIIDNVLCNILQTQLPQYGLIYLNYHGTLWHTGTCSFGYLCLRPSSFFVSLCLYPFSVAIWNIIQCQIAFGIAVREKIGIEIRHFCAVFPYIAIRGEKAEKCQ